MRLRFYRDPDTGLPHLRRHGVTEDDTADARRGPARSGARVAIGQTQSGRHLRVIYVADAEPDSVFVITAYELTGKPLLAYRRRRRRGKTKT